MSKKLNNGNPGRLENIAEFNPVGVCKVKTASWFKTFSLFIAKIKEKKITLKPLEKFNDCDH